MVSCRPDTFISITHQLTHGIPMTDLFNSDGTCTHWIEHKTVTRTSTISGWTMHCIMGKLNVPNRRVGSVDFFLKHRKKPVNNHIIRSAEIPLQTTQLITVQWHSVIGLSTDTVLPSCPVPAGSIITPIHCQTVAVDRVKCEIMIM